MLLFFVEVPPAKKGNLSFTSDMMWKINPLLPLAPTSFIFMKIALIILVQI
jgi:hypothetical protein